MTARLLFVHALSPLHAGTGQGVGVIDLPIAREKATGLPYLPGSSLKGSLRDLGRDLPLCEKIFGPPTTQAELYAGAAQFSDQRLLLLPIRSLKGTFAWVTSPYLLQRLRRDAQDTDLAAGLPASVPQPADESHCFVGATGSRLVLDDKVILEEIDLTVAAADSTDAWATWLAPCLFPSDLEWQAMFKARLCLVHDDVLGYLLSTATEVTARIRLQDETKTVADGGLWYEEALPTETILSGLVVAPTQANGLSAKTIYETIEGLLGHTIQFGGKATVGRGLCRVRLAKEQDQ